MEVLYKSKVETVTSWPLVWEPMVLEPMRGPGRRENIEVPFRRCPHGGYFMDEQACPPRLLNAWGVFDLPGCDDGWCRVALRVHHKKSA